MAHPVSGRALIRLSSVINRELHKCSLPPDNPSYYHIRKSYFHCSSYQDTAAQRKPQWNLCGNHFLPSAWHTQNCAISSSFSGLPLESVVLPNDSSSTQQTSKPFEEIRNYLHKLSTNDEENWIQKAGKQISEHVQYLSDEEIIKVLNLLDATQAKGKYFAELFNSLDNECVQRAKSWQPRKSLQVVEKFNPVLPHFSSKFVKDTALSWANNLGSLNAQELVVFLLAVRRGRSFPQKLNRDLLEKRLSEVLDELTLSQLGIVCACFFESKQGIREVQLIDRLVGKLVDNVEEMDERTIGSMLKLFRKSSFDSTNYSKRVLELQRILLPRVTNWGPMVLIQLASVGTNLLYFEHSTIEKVTQKFMDCIQTARVKDLERLAMVISISCHRTPSVQHFWNLVEIELVKSERREEIHQYAYSFISLAAYAIMSNVYMEKLVKMALDPQIVQSALDFSANSDYNSTKRELLMLCCSLDIEHPEYDGPRLPATELHKYQKAYQRPIPQSSQSKLTNHEKFLLSLHESTQELFSDAQLEYLQPHFISPDVIFTYHGDKRKGQLPSNGEPKKFALVAGSRNMYSRFRCSPMGPLRMKTRQLETLGYVLIPVPWFEFLPLDPKTRIAYLDKKIRSGSKNLR